MTIDNSEIILKWYIDLEERFVSLTKSIPINPKNIKVELPLLASIIVEGGSLIDTIFREECNNGKRKDRNNIGAYCKYFEPQIHLMNALSVPLVFPPQYLNPFKGWYVKSRNDYKARKWWQNYNFIKHSRIENSHFSTMETAFLTLCGLHQVMTKIDIFIDSLLRNGFVSYDGLNLDYLLNKIRNKEYYGRILIETKLFATPFGIHNFPKDINHIRPIDWGSSRKFSEFLGRES